MRYYFRLVEQRRAKIENGKLFQMEENETPHNPNYYLVINEFKARAGGGKLLLAALLHQTGSVVTFELTFSVYSFYGLEKIKIKKSWKRKTIFTLERKIYAAH